MAAGRLLTPTQKLKRRGINERFADEIESIYAKDRSAPIGPGQV